MIQQKIDRGIFYGGLDYASQGRFGPAHLHWQSPQATDQVIWDSAQRTQVVSCTHLMQILRTHTPIHTHTHFVDAATPTQLETLFR